MSASKARLHVASPPARYRARTFQIENASQSPSKFTDEVAWNAASSAASPSATAITSTKFQGQLPVGALRGALLGPGPKASAAAPAISTAWAPQTVAEFAMPAARRRKHASDTIPGPNNAPTEIWINVEDHRGPAHAPPNSQRATSHPRTSAATMPAKPARAPPIQGLRRWYSTAPWPKSWTTS